MQSVVKRSGSVTAAVWIGVALTAGACGRSHAPSVAPNAVSSDTTDMGDVTDAGAVPDTKLDRIRGALGRVASAVG
ncbi:MAG: hypothetical protein M3282_01845, partial [Gemmatimonadota bacterium]|nr:hypothetical protein [Gemmatimonadota bacterium]